MVYRWGRERRFRHLRCQLARRRILLAKSLVRGEQQLIVKILSGRLFYGLRDRLAGRRSTRGTSFIDSTDCFSLSYLVSKGYAET